ncbi:hypothetical protein ACTXT7_000111 [Hymenolepis weldensis]
MRQHVEWNNREVELWEISVVIDRIRAYPHLYGVAELRDLRTKEYVNLIIQAIPKKRAEEAQLKHL